MMPVLRVEVPSVAVSDTAVSELTEDALAVKLAETTPAGMASVVGMLNSAGLWPSATVTPAVVVTVTTHVAVPGASRAEGEHRMLLTPDAPRSVMEALFEANPRVAVRLAVTSETTEAALAVKLAETYPAGTTTVDGTVSDGLSLLSDIEAPEAVDSTTVHSAVPGVVMLVGEQIRLLNVAGAFSVRLASFETEPNVAVMLAQVSTLTVDALAVKLA